MANYITNVTIDGTKIDIKDEETSNNLTAHIKANNPHHISKATIGLENVDNTKDSEKSVLHATTADRLTNGNGISSIRKTGTNGLVDTYTIQFNDGTTSTFSVTNGKGISSIRKTGTNGLVDTYTITLTDGTTSTFTVTNGEGLQNLQVGGRNLLTNTNKGELSYNYPNEGKIGIFQRENLPIPGYATQFVLSFEAKSTIAGDIIHSLFYNPSNIISSENSEGIDATYRNGDIPTSLTTDWKRYWVKWTAPIANTRNIIPVRLVNGDGTGTVSIRNIKFETGNVPTDWTPAPEDLETTPIPNSDIDTILNS